MWKRALPLLFSGLALCAQPGPHGHGPFLPPFEALNLSESQKSSIHQILARHHEALKAKGEVARNAHRALVDGITTPATPEADLKALHEAAASAGFEVAKEFRAIVLEVDPLLSPEQRAKAQELKATFRTHLDHVHRLVLGD